MKIESFDISFDSRHSLIRSEEPKSLVKNIFQGTSSNLIGDISSNDSVSISSEARQKYINKKFSTTDSFSKISKIRTDKNSKSGNRQKELISKMVSHVSGLELAITDEISLSKSDSAGKLSSSPGRIRGNMPFEFTFEEVHFTEIEEKTIVNTSGMVTTEDGREIKFGMHLGMERDFYMEEARPVKLIDPLVIQFEDGPPEFSDNIFSFDLNGDGEKETLQTPGKGSGFLAFDINKDGKINDGSELFGGVTGNGFAELSAFDDDGNGWIDENDEVYSRLSIWAPASGDKNSEIKDLASLDIGAIYLGSAESSHTITDEKGNTKAQLKSTGMYLKESGEAGHVYQLDLADLKKDEKLEFKNDISKEPENISEPIEKPDYFKGIGEKIAEFRDSLDKMKSSSNNLGDRSVFDELLDDLKNRLEELMKIFDEKKKNSVKSAERYKKNFLNNEI